MVKIYKGETPEQEMGVTLQEEMTNAMKDGALKFGCSAEEMKCRVNNMGLIEVARMSGQEMIEMEVARQKKKLLNKMLKKKGISSV